MIGPQPDDVYNKQTHEVLTAMKRPIIIPVLILLGLSIGTLVYGQTYLWYDASDDSSYQTVADIDPPAGFSRLPVADTAFDAWLRNLPLKKAASPVLLHDGRRKGNQEAHARIIDIDVGKANLQQCADAVMRLRAEYLYSRKTYDAIHFNFTSGDTCAFAQWIDGYRPRIDDNRVTWEKTAAPDSSYRTFRKYLTTVFTYAGSYSLSQELEPVANPDNIRPGDVFIQGGFPGHAVIVIDLAVDAETGERAFLLAQSYMPAQDIHVLKNRQDRELSPWYVVDPASELVTPEWIFEWGDLTRFR